MGTKRILIVEDNLDTAHSLSALLESYGHTVSVAATGLEGLAAAAAAKPDIAILDIGLPGMDGHELARQLRLQLNGAGCLIIAATAYSRDEDVARSVAAGFDAYFVKPVPLLRLIELIDED